MGVTGSGFYLIKEWSQFLWYKEFRFSILFRLKFIIITPYYILNVWRICSNFPSLSLDIGNFCLLFHLICLARVYQFCWSSQRPSCWFQLFSFSFVHFLFNYFLFPSMFFPFFFLSLLQLEFFLLPYLSVHWSIFL